MVTDWAAVREACMQHGRRRGLSLTQAEDAAQEAIALALEHEPDNAAGYAFTVCGRVAGKMLEVEGRVVELTAGVEPTSRPEQYAHVLAGQLAFILRVSTTTELVDLIDGVGGGGRMARMRARAAVRDALQESSHD